MQKLNWKQRLLFVALIIVTYLVIALPFDIIRVNEDIKDQVLQAVIFGVLFGLGFPFLLEIWAPRLLAGIKIPELNKGERIIFEEGANLFRSRINAVGGKLVLSNQRLLFIPHRYNFQREQAIIKLKDIKVVIPGKITRIANKSLRVISRENAEYYFTVNNREEWIRQLEGLIH